jgi:FkbM family methyltransferase
VIDPGQLLTLNVRGGARICVPADINQITTYILLEQEDWFEDEIRFVRRWLRPGMRAVDVGASYGIYTAAMARAVGVTGRVWAFEPTPQVADCLQRGLDLDVSSHVAVSRSAVSGRSGTLAFAAGANSELNAVGPSGATLQVPSVTLDQMSAAQDWQGIDFLKLDVEGHELEAIRGGAAFFDAASPLVMLEVKADNRFDLRALDLLQDSGYGAYRMLPGPLMLVPFDRHGAVDEFLLNLFACKEGRARELAAAGFLATLEVPPGSAGAEKAAWADYAASAPYARAFAANWRPRAGLFAGSDVRTYFEGLAAFAQSRRAAMAPAERVAWLQRSLQCVADAIEANGTPARQLSYARIAAELGWRVAAENCLVRAIDMTKGGDMKSLQEPFIAPSERYERMDASADPAGWLTCAAVEQYEKLRYYSSMFADKTSLEVLAPIGDLPYRSAEMDRRRNLVRRRHGMPAASGASALLLARSEENLNPQYWSEQR